LGVEGLVVVQVGDVLMVCPRDRAQDVRALTLELEQLGETRLL
jgi:mannose-1-phosphate guanylyltransferase